MKSTEESRLKTSPVWLRFGWSRRVEVCRGCWLLFMTGPVTWACAHYISGILSLVVLAVSAWPYSYRARWTAEGLDVRWLFVRDRLRIQDIQRVRLRAAHGLFRKKLALEIGLASGRRTVVDGEPPILEYFYGKITNALMSRGRALGH